MRYELSDNEWSAIRVMLPNKSRGVARADDRRVLNGIFWVLRSGVRGAIFRMSMVPARPAANFFVRVAVGRGVPDPERMKANAHVLKGRDAAMCEVHQWLTPQKTTTLVPFARV